MSRARETRANDQQTKASRFPLRAGEGGAGAEHESQRSLLRRMLLGCLSIRAGTAPSPAQQRELDAAYPELVLGSELPAMSSPRPNRTMQYEPGQIMIRGMIVAGMVCGVAVAACAQTGSKLPPNPPTSISNTNAAPAPIAAASPRADTAPRHRARVTYANGLLQVRADNSSLNQILREISQQTGMR